MKQKLLFLAALLTFGIFSSAQTATEFVSTDCAGTQHDLFADLDAGKVVILTWVMPCGGCIAPANQAYAMSQSFAASYPGRVEFWIADDYGNLNCTTLSNWVFSNGMHCPCFSDSTIRMSDYGPYGMPKTVVLGGTDHHVFYLYDAGQDTAALHSAIDSALLATGVGIIPPPPAMNISVSPNPAGAASTVYYSLPAAGNVTIEIFSLTGEKVETLVDENRPFGNFEAQFDTGKLAAGNYVLRMTFNGAEKTTQLTVKHQ